MVTLRRISRRTALQPLRAEFGEWWSPPYLTKFWEALEGPQVVGIVGARYVARRLRRPSYVTIEGIAVFKAFRGRGLQNVLRTAAVAALRSPRCRSKILVKTYVNVENIASMRNLCKSGFLPVRTFNRVFVEMEGRVGPESDADV